MPNTRSNPTKPATRTKSASRRRKPLLFTAIGLVIIIGAAFGVYAQHQHAMKADKARFTQAEQDISELSQAIIAATGQPLKVDNQKFCSRPSVEIGKGPLSCDVDWYGFYAIENEAQASLLYSKTTAVLDRHWTRTSTRNSGDFVKKDSFTKINITDYSYRNDYQQVQEIFAKNQNYLQCRASYTFYTALQPPYTNYLKESSSPYVLAIKFGCGDSTRAQIYPFSH